MHIGTMELCGCAKPDKFESLNNKWHYPIQGCTGPYSHESKNEWGACSLAAQVPLAGLVDEFGFEIPKGETASPVTVEDFKLIRGFLGNLKDQTLSRSIHRVLTDLLERLPK